ncbi:hypothetical protein LINGRAHAP2_LOCUS12590, partial [Linum grandiflorum]
PVKTVGTAKKNGGSFTAYWPPSQSTRSAPVASSRPVHQFPEPESDDSDSDEEEEEEIPQEADSDSEVSGLTVDSRPAKRPRHHVQVEDAISDTNSNSRHVQVEAAVAGLRGSSLN